jgi:ABC-2 type transport system ATP-binding protein
MGTLDELRRLMGERDLVRFTGQFDPNALRGALQGIDGLEIVSIEEKMLLVAVEGAPRKLTAILSAVLAAGGEVQETSLSQPSLESLFIKLTGRALRE